MADGAGTSEDPLLSVIVACDGALEQLADRLGAIARACVGLSVEVIVVYADYTTITIPPQTLLSVTSLRSPSALVPVLWARGISASRGHVVALTTTQFRVREGWGHALLAAFRSPSVAAAGGRVVLAESPGVLRRAMFLVRYSEHMGDETATRPREIAGDNAAYLRAAVNSVRLREADGFWEVDIHRLLRGSGMTISSAPDAVAEFAPSLTLSEMLANRFVHGRHYGEYRVRTLRWPRWRALVVVPLVPALLFYRILIRMQGSGQRILSAVTAMPAMVLLLVVWAAGEGYGALARSHRVNER